MEGSESEAIFESLNLKPQLFINEVLNSVDDLVDGAFDFFRQEASTLLKTTGTDREADLKKGVDYIHHKVQATLDKRLNMWEKYCLHHCFVVPDGVSLPDKDQPMNEFEMDFHVLTDQESDSQLNLLRKRLAQIGKESAELSRQLQALERQSSTSSLSATAVTEALQLYEQSSMHELFGEMVKTAAELRAKMEKLRTKRMEESKHRRDTINESNGYIPRPTYNKGLSNVKLEDLQRFLDEIKKS